MTKIGSYVILSSVAFLLMMVWPSALGADWYDCDLSKNRCEKCKASANDISGRLRCEPKKDDGISTNNWCCAEDKKPWCDVYSECKKKCKGECSFDGVISGWPCWKCDDGSKGEKWDKGKCDLSKKKCDECAADKGEGFDLHCVKEDERGSSWCCAEDKKPMDCQNYDECKKKCKGDCEFNIKKTMGWPCWKCVEPNTAAPKTEASSALVVLIVIPLVVFVLIIVIVVVLVVCARCRDAPTSDTRKVPSCPVPCPAQCPCTRRRCP